MTLGRKIEFLRKERGWTQAQLADQLTMTAHHVSRWENDRIRPRDKALGKLAELFEVSVEELLAAKKDTHPDLAASDPELASMVAELARLDDEQRFVIKHVLRSMLTCRQMEQLVSQSRLKIAN